MACGCNVKEVLDSTVLYTGRKYVKVRYSDRDSEYICVLDLEFDFREDTDRLEKLINKRYLFRNTSIRGVNVTDYEGFKSYVEYVKFSIFPVMESFIKRLYHQITGKCNFHEMGLCTVIGGNKDYSYYSVSDKFSGKQIGNGKHEICECFYGDVVEAYDELMNELKRYGYTSFTKLTMYMFGGFIVAVQMDADLEGSVLE